MLGAVRIHGADRPVTGGARVYATVRRPAPEGQKVVPTVWSVYPTKHLGSMARR